jgi:hypothetical protein
MKKLYSALAIASLLLLSSCTKEVLNNEDYLNPENVGKFRWCTYSITASDCAAIRPPQNICFLCNPSCPNFANGQKVKIGVRGNECIVTIGNLISGCGPCDGQPVAILD